VAAPYQIAERKKRDSFQQLHMQGLASFPGLHAQLVSLAVRKAGEGLDGFIT